MTGETNPAPMCPLHGSFTPCHWCKAGAPDFRDAAPLGLEGGVESAPITNLPEAWTEAPGLGLEGREG